MSLSFKIISGYKRSKSFSNIHWFHFWATVTFYYLIWSQLNTFSVSKDKFNTGRVKFDIKKSWWWHRGNGRSDSDNDNDDNGSDDDSRRNSNDGDADKIIKSQMNIVPLMWPYITSRHSLLGIITPWGCLWPSAIIAIWGWVIIPVRL